MAELPEDAQRGRQTDADGAVIDHSMAETTVYLDGAPQDEGDPTFGANLAKDMTRDRRQSLADEIIGMVNADEESRSEWKSRLAKGLELLGLKDRPKDDEPFAGASSVTHPLLAEAVTQFNARALPELAPAAGPAKAVVIGEQTEERDAQAERVADYLNYRLTIDDDEWFDDTDQLLFYLPIGGSAFRKVFLDPVTGKAMARYVKAEDFIVPYKARSLSGAVRYTHRYELSGNDIRRAIARGTFVPIAIDASDAPEQNDALEDTADSRQYSVGDGDAVHRIYEAHLYYDLGETDQYSQEFTLPYIVTVDVDQGDVLDLRRNWDEDDDGFQKKLWFVHYRFLPGLGFYGFGFLHLIGGLAAAATGALRALLDSAARSNLQGGFKAKEARNARGDMTIEQGVYKDIDLTAEELSKAFYTPNWPPPSPALFNLLGGLVDAGQRFASTTDVQVGDASNQAPVGTTVALIEQGQKVFSTIHLRLHRAAGHELRLFAELDAASLDADTPYPYRLKSGKQEIRAEDFSEDIDIVPVSDPNIFSSTQRIAMAQSVVQLVESSPDLYGLKEKCEAHQRLLIALSVPDADQILPEIGITRRDPVTENQYMMVGKAVTAFPEQDHQAHLQVHRAAASQFAGAKGEAAQRFQMAMQAHVAEHFAHNYRQALIRRTGLMLPAGLHPEEEPEQLDIETENLIARAVAMQVQPAPSPSERQMSAEQMAVAAEQKRKDAEVMAEQKRKDAAAAAEQRRKSRAFMADEAREQQDWRAEQAREQADWQHGQARETAEWQAEQARAAAADEQERRRAGTKAALENMQRAVERPAKPPGNGAV